MNRNALNKFRKANIMRKSYHQLTMRERTRFKTLNPKLWKWICVETTLNNKEND